MGKPMKALLLRVGIDTGSGRARGPIFWDGSFEYIPIPEGRETREQRTYAQLLGRKGEPLSTYLPKRLAALVPHIDPEFETFTYSDPTKVKRLHLMQLQDGDLLVFYAGLRPSDYEDAARLFLIGSFDVETVVSFTKDTPRRNAWLRPLRTNAHMKRVESDEDLVIVKGRSELSRLGPCLPDVWVVCQAGCGHLQKASFFPPMWFDPGEHTLHLFERNTVREVQRRAPFGESTIEHHCRDPFGKARREQHRDRAAL